MPTILSLPTEDELQAALAVAEEMGRDYPRITPEMTEAGLRAIEPTFCYRGKDQIVRDIFIAMWRQLPRGLRILASSSLDHPASTTAPSPARSASAEHDHLRKTHGPAAELRGRKMYISVKPLDDQ